MKLLDNFKEKKLLIDENAKIRKGKRDVEDKYNQMLEDIDIIQKKYTSLLEEKSDHFDLYIKYQQQCEDLSKEKRSLKKQLAETNEMCNSLTKINDEMTKTIEKLNSKITRLEKRYVKNEVIQ